MQIVSVWGLSAIVRKGLPINLISLYWTKPKALFCYSQVEQQKSPNQNIFLILFILYKEQFLQGPMRQNAYQFFRLEFTPVLFYRYLMSTACAERPDGVNQRPYPLSLKNN